MDNIMKIESPPIVVPSVVVDGREYGLGRAEGADKRNAFFPMSAVLEAESAKSGIRYYRTGPTLDQRDKPHCVGFSWRQWVSSAPKMTKTGPTPEHIYFEAQKIDEWEGENYDGTSVGAGAKILRNLGYFPSYVWARNATEVANFILEHGTVVFGTSWYRDMFYPDPKTGFVKPTGRLSGGHAYLCIGYNSKTGAFRFINSWGNGWGQKGRFWIAGENVDKLFREEWGEACGAVEQLVVATR